MFEADFLDLMPETIYRSTVVSRTLYATRTASTSRTAYRARVTAEAREIRKPDGQAVMSLATIWVASTARNLSADDMWFLPAGVLPTTAPTIITATCVEDQDGPHHWKLQAGW